MVKLRGITWDHPRGYQPLAASAKPYAEQFGVEVEWHKRSLKDFGDAPIHKLAEDFDILIVDHPHMGLAYATGCLLPLDEHVEPSALATLAAQSAGPSHASYFYAGHQWALAVDAAMQGSAYRPDLFEGEFPTDWQSVLALGERVRDNSRWIGLPLVPTDCICCFVSLYASLGDPPGQAEGVLLKDDSVGLHALELLDALRKVSHPDSLSWNPIQMLNHMSTHDDLVYCPLTFTYTNYSRDGYAPNRVKYTNIPGVKGSILGGAGYSVSSHCQHVEAAVAYGIWLCSADIQRALYVENGGQPGNGVAWQDEYANRLTHNFFHDTFDTLNNAYVRPRYDGYHVFQEKAGNVIHTMLREETSAGACLARIKLLHQETLHNRRE